MATRLVQPAEDSADIPETQPDELANFFKALEPDGDAGSVQVSQIEGDERSYLFTFNPTHFDPTQLLDYLLEQWGPGTYQLLPRGANGQMRGGRKNVRVGPIVGKNSLPRGPLKQKEEATRAPGVDPNLAAILQSQQRLLEQIATAVTRQPEQPRSTFDQLREFAEMQKLMSPPRESSDAGNLSGMLQLVRDVLAFKNEIGSEADDDGSPLTAAIKYLGPTLAKAVETMQIPNRRALAPPELGNGTPVSDAPRSLAGDPMGKLIAPYVPQIVQAAQSGVPINYVAKMAVEQLYANLPADRLGPVLQWLDDDNAVDKLGAIDRRVLAHRDYCDKLVDAIFALVREAAAAAEVAPAEGAEAGGDELRFGSFPDSTPASEPTQSAGLGRDVGDWQPGEVDSPARGSSDPGAASAAAAQSGPDNSHD